MSIDQKDFLLSASKFELPEAIDECGGIQVGSNTIRSVLMSTDLSFINSIEADSVMAVHPFEKSEKMDRVIINFSQNPVFCDIGGGLLNQNKSISVARNSLGAGAAGVILSRPTPAEVVANIRSEINGLLIYTIMYDGEPVEDLSGAGVDIFSVSTGKFTAESVNNIKERIPNIPIMASGGPYNSTIRETIRAGADAIVYIPPTATEMMRSVFDGFRNSNR